MAAGKMFRRGGGNHNKSVLVATGSKTKTINANTYKPSYDYLVKYVAM